MAEPSARIAITGAAGNLGRRLRAHLQRTQATPPLLLDIDPRGDDDIVQADLSRYDPVWADRLRGTDILVHFAACPTLGAAWPELLAPNVDAVINLYRAAADAGIGRIVLASSVWAMAARRDDADPIGTPLPDPGKNPYGASKLFAERLAAAYADSHGIATLALRIGGCPAGANRPPRQDRWSNDCWLSTGDFLHAMDCALRTPFAGFHVVNLTSANPSNRWSLAEARALIGYAPRDTWVPPPPPTPPPSVPRRIARRLRRMLRRPT